MATIIVNLNTKVETWSYKFDQYLIKLADVIL